MKTVRLIHFNEDQGLERRKQLEAFGFDAVRARLQAPKVNLLHFPMFLRDS